MRSRVLGVLLVVAVFATPLAAIVESRVESELQQYVVLSPRLAVTSAVAPMTAIWAESAVGGAWRAFEARRPGWHAFVDAQGGFVQLAEGAGIPWIPGRGNRLVSAVTSAARTAPTMSTLEAAARAFVPGVAGALGVDPSELVLNPGRSGQLSDYLWFVDFDLVRDGLPIEGARVLFRVNNGNLVQFGAEAVPSPQVRVPVGRVSLEKAFAILTTHVGGLDEERDRFVDTGSLHLLTTREAKTKGYGLAKVWQFVFRREGDPGTWRARIDAATGEVLEFADLTVFGKAVGGAYQADRPAGANPPPASELSLALPFADIGGGLFTNSAGLFGGIVGTTTLTGQFVRIVDTCGAVSKPADGSGLIDLGGSGGTDCTVPAGGGGAGNTHASRTQFYNVNRAKEVGRGWLPANPWLNAQLTVNVNINNTCNASWNGTALNFFRSGGGCNNTGELPGVSLHEYGHGLDSNDGGGGSPDNGTGETYGDFTAALSTHNSCIGNGFVASGANCGGYGDACTSCSGVRDIDWGKHVANTPHTVNNFTRPTCPQPSPTNPNYVGPCGIDAINDGVASRKREGHCESMVSSEALWDFANRDLPSPGSGSAWSVTDQLWYLSRPTVGAAFVCETSGATWTSNGCAASNYFQAMKAVDDDDGNLANGTPHACQLFAAFNRHGIACGVAADPGNQCFSGCTPPAVPTLSSLPTLNGVELEWTNSGANVRYDVYRNETGCNAGFARIGDDVNGLSFFDNGVATGTTYFYQVKAQPVGNQACAAAPSNCLVVSPCNPGPAPGGVTAIANGDNRIDVSWTAVGGATSYRVYRSTTSGGPYTFVASLAASPYVDNTVDGGVTYYYVVRAVGAGPCQSVPSAQASAATTGPCGLAPTFAGATSATTPNTAACSVNVSWTAATPTCGAGVTYNVYRSTTTPFSPSSANRIAQGIAGTTFSDASGLASGVNYHYIVRAVGSANGVEDSNTVTRTVAPFGVLSATSYYGPQGFETCSGLCGWTTALFGGSAADWRGRQNCTAHGGTEVFRYGGSMNCTANYGNGNLVAALPFAVAGLTVAPGAKNSRVDFWHRWNFESTFDGGLIALSFDGANYSVVPTSAFLLGPYNSSASGLPAWSGAQATFVHSTLDLDAACNAVRGTPGGCAGATVHVGFTASTDGLVTDDGWFIDDVSIFGDVPAACGATPNPVQFFTATAKVSSFNVLEWQTPAAGPCTNVRVCASTSSFPTTCPAVSAIATVPCAGNDTRGSFSPHVGSVGTKYFYSAFVESGGQLSARKTATAIIQTAANTPPSQWTYNSGGAALSPPGIGSLFALANDRVLHSVAPGNSGTPGSGLWPTGWKPFAMNAPAQQRPPVIDPGIGGAKTVLIGSQDGRAYAVNGSTGAQIWSSPVLGGMIQAAPAAVLTAFGGSKDLVFVGTRDATANNKFYALDWATGTVAANWPFDNGGGANGIGIINSMADVDYAASRVYFTSRARAGGSSGTVWCLSFAGSSPALCAGSWPRAIGDVDGSAIRVGTRLYIGTNAGTVVALDATTGATAWTFTPAPLDGAVKGFVFPRFGTSPLQLVFSTTTRVWNIVDNGASAALAPGWPAGGINAMAGPSIPLPIPFGSKIYVGSTGGNLWEIDANNPSAPPKVAILPDAATTGAPSLDTSTGLVHVGALSGAINAVAVPLP